MIKSHRMSNRKKRSMKKSKAMKKMMGKMMGGTRGSFGHNLRRSESGYGPERVNLKRAYKPLSQETLHELVNEAELNRRNSLRYPHKSPSFHRALSEEQLRREEPTFRNLFNRHLYKNAPVEYGN